ncbi:hypothetical protein BV25DRAFT_961627 [Artomyces pyxidatus]|uniref:Uncharacterized protein n=1 Tax=Artomyces pyxidatus TaxID=48021 RepID=A0ACB8SVA2_9AGAM|nr:hypothetical protein BV25DRAFT_961627 [Artomyces pyxidatus]
MESSQAAITRTCSPHRSTDFSLSTSSWLAARSIIRTALLLDTQKRYKAAIEGERDRIWLVSTPLRTRYLLSPALADPSSCFNCWHRIVRRGGRNTHSRTYGTDRAVSSHSTMVESVCVSLSMASAPRALQIDLLLCYYDGLMMLRKLRSSAGFRALWFSVTIKPYADQV